MNKVSIKNYPNIFFTYPFIQPCVQISPFLPKEFERILSGATNSSHPSEFPGFWLDKAKAIRFLSSGREALLTGLKDAGLHGQDEVLIVKNTEGPYISGCVTKTIEKICRWSQSFSPRTRLVLVIHEFGFPCPAQRILPYKKMGIPIIEDCAYALGSRIEGASIGKIGDYAIYSLSKYYPIPFGGVLVSKKKFNVSLRDTGISSFAKNIVLQILRGSRPYIKKWNQTRRNNWLYFKKHTSPIGCPPFFSLSKNIVPGVYLMRVPKSFRGEIVKKRLNQAGIVSTQFYHQGGFYFPVHQFLSEYEKEYILHHLME
jgi:DegT/DnrJ/EryC1/StrS aminotransferase family